MVLNTIDTCPEMSNIRLTESIVKVQHTAAEKKKYNETLTVVQTELKGLHARGRIHTRLLQVLRLLNDLRCAAVDPFGVTIQARAALAVGDGPQFENENDRRNIILVPVAIFGHVLYPDSFPVPAQGNVRDVKYLHVKKVQAIESLKDCVHSMQKVPPELPACPICLESGRGASC